MNRYAMICLAFLLILIPMKVGAANVKLTSIDSGMVIDVADGDAIVVRLDSGNLAYVRLVGIDSKANDSAISFLTSYLLGKKVLIEPELSIPSSLIDTRWNYGYVFLNVDNSLSTYGKEMINETMLYKGYAVMNASHYSISNYSSLLTAQSYSRASALGLWDYLDDVYNVKEKININTASSSQLYDHFEDASLSLCDDIVRFREKSPFKKVSDIKFVTGMTKELFDSYRYSLSVVTSLNYALEYELATLSNISSSDVNRIINYRRTKNFGNVSEVYSGAKIDQDTYEENLPFLSLSEKDSIDIALPDLIVNINTALPSQISEIDGVSSADANRIVEYRRNKLYGYKNIFELTNLPGISLRGQSLHYVCDNFSLITNINKAADNELRSLLATEHNSTLFKTVKEKRPFSQKSELKDIVGEQKYTEIEPYFYIGSIPTVNRVNINTATRTQLKSVNLTDAAINSIINKQGFMYTANDIPVDTAYARERISLYTDINTAADNELLSLNPDMINILTNLKAYREDQPFGSINEVEKFFSSRSEFSLFKMIEPFIVIR